MLNNLKKKIEERRNLQDFFSKAIVRLKDFLWESKINWEIARSGMKMKKIDKNNIPRKKEIRLFMKVRNESLRLPYLFQYYSKLGVDRFFIIDNNSTDKALDFLLSQKNTHIFQTKERYSKGCSGHRWIDFLLKKYGWENWCLVVDADEIFIYPHCEKISIKKLCEFLDNENSQAVNSLLLDIYSKRPIFKTEYKESQNPIKIFPFFDKNSYVVEKNLDLGIKVYKGGMRKRVFGVYPILNKVTLFKANPGIKLIKGHHFIKGARLSKIQGTVLHFKFSKDFIPKVLEEAQREEYSYKADRYKEYAKKVIENPNLNLYYKGSIKFKGIKHLIKLGKMKTSKEFEIFAADLLNKKGLKND